VADGTTWRPDDRRRCAERVELIDVAPGHRTERMFDELADHARELFGTDLGLDQRRARAATSS
jgi:hypothetical protein